VIVIELYQWICADADRFATFIMFIIIGYISNVGLFIEASDVRHPRWLRMTMIILMVVPGVFAVTSAVYVIGSLGVYIAYEGTRMIWNVVEDVFCLNAVGKQLGMAVARKMIVVSEEECGHEDH
jgi:predicted membrane channel-forming protein YqfA (hemolysin III family)